MSAAFSRIKIFRTLAGGPARSVSELSPASAVGSARNRCNLTRGDILADHSPSLSATIIVIENASDRSDALSEGTRDRLNGVIPSQY